MSRYGFLRRSQNIRYLQGISAEEKREALCSAIERRHNDIIKLFIHNGFLRFVSKNELRNILCCEVANLNYNDIEELILRRIQAEEDIGETSSDPFPVTDQLHQSPRILTNLREIISNGVLLLQKILFSIHPQDPDWDFNNEDNT